MSIMAQTEAGFFVISVASPAIIPPMIPPTSNKVDRFPDVVAVKLTPKKIKYSYIKDEYFFIIFQISKIKENASVSILVCF